MKEYLVLIKNEAEFTCEVIKAVSFSDVELQILKRNKNIIIVQITYGC